MHTVYCVEDDANIRELIEYALTSTGFAVKGFAAAADFFAGLQSVKPDLILLDIMLPDMDGMEILKALRINPDTEFLPVIMLTARSERMDKIKGLDCGADDYITKPFDVLELISRVKALLRRSNTTEREDSEIVYREIRLDYKKRLVTVEGKEIALTFKEFELLHMLLAAGGNVVPREKIILAVWGTDYEGESRTLDVHIRTLRQKLGAAGNHIETIRNVGYKVG